MYHWYIFLQTPTNYLDHRPRKNLPVLVAEEVEDHHRLLFCLLLFELLV